MSTSRCEVGPRGRGRTPWLALAALLALPGLAACDPTTCVRNSQCARGYTCRATVCVLEGDAGTQTATPGTDGGAGSADPSDAGVDASFVLP